MTQIIRYMSKQAVTRLLLTELKSLIHKHVPTLSRTQEAVAL